MSIIMDPTNEQVPVERSLAERSGEIVGRLALLNISKPRGEVLLGRFETLLSERLPGVEINSYTKPTFAKPAPDDLRREILENNDFLIEALAD